ncbi:MAG: GldG family protein [Pseudomonadales bacterium]|nr:GldG family protein [Pseudomonadales bacterium]
MKNKILKRQPLIIFIAMISLTLGLLAFYITQSFTLLSAGVCLLGGLVLGLCLLLQLTTSRQAPNLARWRSMSIIFAIITFSAAAVVAVNYVAYQSPYRWDMTQAKQHTLNVTTSAVVHALQQPVKITVLTVGLPAKYLQDLLNEYRRQSNGYIETEIIDPIENIAYAAQFETVISSRQSKLIVRSGDEERVVDFSDSTLSQEALTNAIIRVTRPQRKACFVTGHDEYMIENKEPQGLTTFVSLLVNNNIHSENVMLGITDSISQDCDVLIIAGPKIDFSEHEQLLIEAYLLRGGDALFLIENIWVSTADKPLTEAQLHKNPSLNEILNKWGINISTDTVVDLSSHVGGDAGSPATRNYGQHKAITAGLDYTFYVRPRSITVLDDYRPSIKLAPIVVTSSGDKSWGETDRMLNVHFDQGVDIPGPVALSFVIWEEKTAQDDSDTRIIVFSDADFLSNRYINQYSNAVMAVNVVNWLAELDYQVFIDQQQVKVERLDLTSKQRRMVIALLLLMPLLIAMCGIFVWQRSRITVVKS